jgi:hypothetical protein
MMSIKSLVTEHERIQQAEKKIRNRKYKLQDKLNKMDRGIEIIDGVVWKIEWGWAYGENNQLTKVGKVNEKA